MNNEDKSKINSILLASNTSPIFKGESNNSPSFLVEKDYYDFARSILFARRSPVPVFNKFYEYAKTKGITYEDEVKPKSEVVWMIGSSND